jgi:hypothetical protein
MQTHDDIPRVVPVRPMQQLSVDRQEQTTLKFGSSMYMQCTFFSPAPVIQRPCRVPQTLRCGLPCEGPFGFSSPRCTARGGCIRDFWPQAYTGCLRAWFEAVLHHVAYACSHPTLQDGSSDSLLRTMFKTSTDTSFQRATSDHC